MARRKQQHGVGRALRGPMLHGDLSAWYGWWPEPMSSDDILAGWRAALARRGRPGSPATLQLYTHFAFCQASCAFCQYFHVVPRAHEQYAPYTDYLIGQLRTLRGALGPIEVSNAYFGGGTPSALPSTELGRVVDEFLQTFRVSHEFTCEAHPGSLDETKLALLKRVGVNRLSMGLQSFDPGVLKRIGRTNPPLPRVAELMRRARELGIWVNSDLVLGLPGQTPQSFLDDLHAVLREARPDCLTVYRYQPVPHFPDAPGPEMRYSRILTGPVLRRATRLGYLPATRGGDERPGKAFLRNTGRTWRQWLDRLRYEALRVVRADAELRAYAQFEHNDSHVLGIGPGAMSHIYGHSWYREATAVAGIEGSTAPVYFGTRVSAADECRSTVLQSLAESRWIDTRGLARRSGVDVAAAFDAVLDDGVRSGALRRVGHWYRRAADASPATHPDFYEALLPAIGEAAERDGRAVTLDALRNAPGIQRDLVAIGDHLWADGVPPSANGSAAPPRRSDDALLAWARLIGLGTPGEQFAGALIDRIGGDGEAHFRVLPLPGDPLRVLVQRDTDHPSFLRVGPYAISYVGRTDQQLAPAEERFLRELGARTAQALEEFRRGDAKTRSGTG